MSAHSVIQPTATTGVTSMHRFSALSVIALLVVGCTGTTIKPDLPLEKRFPRQQVTLLLDKKVGAYNCYIDHEQQSLYLCEEVVMRKESK
jgi:hypothetical protein